MKGMWWHYGNVAASQFENLCSIPELFQLERVFNLSTASWNRLILPTSGQEKVHCLSVQYRSLPWESFQVWFPRLAHPKANTHKNSLHIPKIPLPSLVCGPINK